MVSKMIFGSILTIFLVSCNINIHQVISTPSVSNSIQSYPGPPAESDGKVPRNNATNDVYPYPIASNFQDPVSKDDLEQNIIFPPMPEAGKASLSGTIFSFTSQIVVPDTTIYLTPAIGSQAFPPPVLLGPNEENNDVVGRTDNNGELRLNNIPPGNYYLIVWAPNSASIVVDTSDDTFLPLQLVFVADQQYQLGVLEISWP